MKILFTQVLLGILFLSCSSIGMKTPGESPDFDGRDYRLFHETPAEELSKAVESEDLNEIEEIINAQPELLDYQEPKYGNTLLILTIMNQNYKSFRFLIEKGTDLNIHNTYDGTSAIIESVRLRNYDSKYLKELIQKGGNVNDIEVGERKPGNSTRKTPLIAAVGSGKIEFTEILVKSGAEINFYNEFGQSAFGKAIQLSNYEIAFFLLQNGADYKQPIFYRPDYSIPSEKADKKNKGRPMFILDVLREGYVNLNSEEYFYKMKIVDFLQQKGMDYFTAPIPDYIREKAREDYPNSWEDFLEKY